MGKIIGNTVGLPNPRPDWNQTDETKADYIKNKPEMFVKELTTTPVRVVDLEPGVYIIKPPISIIQVQLALGKQYPCTQGDTLIVSGKYHSGNLPEGLNYKFKKGVLLIRSTQNTAAQIVSGVMTVQTTIQADGTRAYTYEWDGGDVEHSSHKITSITESSTNLEYPSALAVYNYGQSILTQIQGDIDNVSALVGGAEE